MPARIEERRKPGHAQVFVIAVAPLAPSATAKLAAPEADTAAAEAAGIAPDRHQRWLEEDPRYWEAFMDAHLEVTDALKGEVIARAIRHHDVRLLVNLLKAWMPEKYR